MPTINLPRFFCSFAVKFEDRHKYKEAGFEYNNQTKEWETYNPFVVKRLGLEFEQEKPEALKHQGYQNHLFPYQKTGIEECLHGLKESDFWCLGDQMGLGKTPMALRVAQECLPEVKGLRIAIVCLANSRRVWYDHMHGNLDHKPKPIDRWLSGSLATEPCNTIYSSKDIMHNSGHIICSYSLAAKMLPDAGDFDFIILDEIQSLGNPASQQTKAVLKFCEEQVEHGAKVLGLTGTWLKNCPIEIYPILNSIGPGLFRRMSYNYFANRYCQPWMHPKTKRLIVEGFRNTEELKYNLRTTCMTRRLVNEVRDDLPEPVFSHIQIEHNDAEIEHLLREEKDMFERFIGVKERGLGLGDYSSLRKTLAQYKAPYIADYIRRRVMPNLEKVCVFCHTIDLARFLQKELRDFGTVCIVGGTPAKNRDDMVSQFQSDPDCQIFIGNIQAAGVAITLTAASTLLFAETSWVPSDNDQVIGRIRRHGQVDQVHIKFMVLRGSLDEQILSKAYWKKEGIAEVLD
jgi:SWI/SNF-related matrix-associated actin-dependent regulator 1 of chromatin subfamily A